MIVIKNARVDELGEPLFEKVNLVIRPDERIAVSVSNPIAVVAFLRALAEETELDEGSIALEGARILHLTSEALQGNAEALAQVFQARPSFLLIETGSNTSPAVIEKLFDLVRSFRGGVLICSNNTSLLQAAKITKVIELDSVTKTVISFTGTYDAYLVEKEKRDTKVNEAYEKQQREKRRLEEWLDEKRGVASKNKKSEKGATIRAKAKYLQREILDKEIPNPNQQSHSEE